MGGPFDKSADDKTTDKTTDRPTSKTTDEPTPDPKPDYERDLGVIEAITVVTRSCPNGGVIAAAERALGAIKAGGPDTLKEQAYFVLTAIQGWRGDRARQVHRSLTRYLDPNALDNRN